jgi:predicted metal-binding membrane protein
MSDTTALEVVFRRDRAVVLVALGVLAALAWAYVLWLAASMDRNPAAMTDMSGMGMPGMNMSGMNMAETAGPDLQSWNLAEFGFMFGMWTVMMVGMMVPSASPMVLIYARVARQARARGKPFAATAWFAGGYLFAWTAFALVATTVQWALERALLLTPMMASASNVFGGALLVAAGLYQWTPLKYACLSQCQSPLIFIQRHGGFRREPRASFRLGAEHGLYCIGCCWALMALLFVGGVMNVLWIAGIAILVLIEKIIPAGRWISWITGTALMGAGAWVLLHAA